MSKTSRLLEELIALPSVNPAFLPTRHPYAGEGRVAEFLAAIAARAGLEIEFQKALPQRPNLVVRLLPKSKPSQRILLAPHLDTVSVVEERQFQPRRKGGRIYGRGACDTKGSVAAMMAALSELAHVRRRPAKTEIILSGLIDEENAQTGSRMLVKSGFKADLAIVGEPTRLQVVTAHKGSLWLTLQTRGKAAHGATPHLGQNAVHTMAQVVNFLETDYATQLRGNRHPLLGPATVSVGSIAGGSQPNIVPDRCLISVDRRTLPGETEPAVCRQIEHLLRGRRLLAKVTGQKLAPCMPLETNFKLPLVRQFLQIVGQARPVGVNFFCDAAVLSHGGIPSVVFGPGDIAQAHTADEWISLDSLERGRKMLLQFLKSLP